MTLREKYSAFICIVSGIYIVISAYKNPDDQLFSRTLGAYIGGITLILVGVLMILGHTYI